MAWETLAGRLKKVPLVLAGPILRQVTPDGVTVWVALQREADVTLTVYTGVGFSRTKLAETTLRTVKVGASLHLIALTAKPASALKEGQIYFYDLSFLDQGVAIVSLAAAVQPPPENPAEPPADPHPFAYPPFDLPSFSLPPTDPNKLRLLHGSCRKPHGEGDDALAIVDDLIAATAESPEGRPHQLLLTGDQIYADDVADALLLVLTDAGETLLGWHEDLPVLSLLGGPKKPAELPPYVRRKALIAAKLTSDDLLSHLMSVRRVPLHVPVRLVGCALASLAPFLPRRLWSGLPSSDKDALQIGDRGEGAEDRLRRESGSHGFAAPCPKSVKPWRTSPAT